MTNKPLNRYLRTYRKHAGLSQGEVAYLIDAGSRSTIGKHENSDSLPDFQALVCYELLFNLPLCDLFEGQYAEIATLFRERAEALLFLLENKAGYVDQERKVQTLKRIIGEEGDALLA